MNKTYIYRGFFYVTGLLVLALGLTLNTKADLGVSAVISVSYSISEIFHRNFGNTTLALYCLFIFIEMILHGYRRKGKQVLVMDLLQFPLSLVFTRFMNFFAELIPAVNGEGSSGEGNYAIRIGIVLTAIALTGIGAAMSLAVRLIPNPGDGIVQALADTFGKSVGTVKNLFDLCNISFAVSISLIVQGHLVGVGIGTILSVIGVGRVIALFNHLFSNSMKKLSGL